MNEGVTTYRNEVSTEHPSLAIIEFISGLEETDPIELTPPLHDVIDPDAIDALFDSFNESPQAQKSLSFTYQGYEVTVRNDGQVVATES